MCHLQQTCGFVTPLHTGNENNFHNKFQLSIITFLFKNNNTNNNKDNNTLTNKAVVPDVAHIVTTGLKKLILLYP